MVRERVGLQVDLIKHFLPFLFYCIEGGSQQVNAFILTHLQSFIRQIISAFEKNEAGESRVGFLLDLMDGVLEEDEEINQKEFVAQVTEILKHSLQVSKVCGAQDETDIVLGKYTYINFNVIRTQYRPIKI